MNHLDKSKDLLTALAEKDWMNYSIELASILFLYMQPATEAIVDADLASRSEILQDLSITDWTGFTAMNLLHIENELRIPNEVLLISYWHQPFMVIQLINGSATSERILNETIYRTLGKLFPPVNASFTLEERIRYFSDKDMTLVASSDHILAFDGISLFTSSTDDFPEIA